jgi:two-component system, response regulator
MAAGSGSRPRSIAARRSSSRSEIYLSDLPIILLVEDNEDDAELTARAFSLARIANPLVRVRDGVEALDYLYARGSYGDRDMAVLPVVVLLDLNLPRLDGIDVLRTIRGHEHTRCLPVVMLTSSDHDRDRLAAYHHQVNSYVKKPIDYDQFTEATRQLCLYWAVLNAPVPPRR